MEALGYTSGSESEGEEPPRKRFRYHIGGMDDSPTDPQKQYELAVRICLADEGFSPSLDMGDPWQTSVLCSHDWSPLSTGAYEWLQRSADGGNVNALWWLYLEGIIPGTKDGASVVRLAAAGGNLFAQCHLLLAYQGLFELPGETRIPKDTGKQLALSREIKANLNILWTNRPLYDYRCYDDVRTEIIYEVIRRLSYCPTIIPLAPPYILV